MTENSNSRLLWIIHISTLLLLVLFIGLGVWQLKRGNVKSQLETSTISVNENIFENLPLPLEDPVSWRYKKVRVHGQYWSDKQFLLDNQVRDQLVGYNVLTPFYVQQSNAWVLVDRGWIPQRQDRNYLPSVEVGDEFLTISATIYVPYQAAFALGEIAEGEDFGWPRRIQFVDYEKLSARLSVQLQPLTLRLTEDNKFGYRRDWATTQIPAKKHYAYSFQWFAMAAALIVLWFIYLVRPKIRSNEKQ